MNRLQAYLMNNEKQVLSCPPDPLEAEVLSTVWMIANEQEQKKDFRKVQ